MSFSELDTKIPATVDDPKALRESISRALRRAARKARAPAAIISGGAGFQARKARARFAWIDRQLHLIGYRAPDD